MVKGTTKSGFDFEIDERLAEDYRFIEAVIIADDNESTDLEKLKAVFNICDFVLGKDKDAFIEHIKKNNDGFVPLTIVKDEVAEIISKSKELKN